MIRRDQLDEDRKRAEAYDALAHPVDDANDNRDSDAASPMLISDEGAETDDTEPDEDILEGLDRRGLDAREP